MPWRRLFTDELRTLRDPGAATDLTLVTLRLVPDPPPHEIAFYDAAERRILVDWGSRGVFILALCNAAGTELELLCPSDADTTRGMILSMPFIVAGLSTFALRPMMLLHVASPLGASAMN